MDFGRNGRRITLQRLQPGQKPSGQPIEQWVDVARPWARIVGKSGRETVMAGQETAEVAFSMRIRYRTDVTAAWRVLYRGQAYEIKAVLPDEAGREHVDLVVTRYGAQEGAGA